MLSTTVCQKKSNSVENATYYLQHLNSVSFMYHWIQSFLLYLTKFEKPLNMFKKKTIFAWNISQSSYKKSLY